MVVGFDDRKVERIENFLLTDFRERGSDSDLDLYLV